MERDSKWTPPLCFLTRFLIHSSPREATSLHYRRYSSLRTSQTWDDISLFLKISLRLARYKILIHTTRSHKLQIHSPLHQSFSFHHCFRSSFASNYKILVWWRSKLRCGDETICEGKIVHSKASIRQGEERRMERSGAERGVGSQWKTQQ